MPNFQSPVTRGARVTQDTDAEGKEDHPVNGAGSAEGLSISGVNGRFHAPCLFRRCIAVNALAELFLRDYRKAHEQARRAADLYGIEGYRTPTAPRLAARARQDEAVAQGRRPDRTGTWLSGKRVASSTLGEPILNSHHFLSLIPLAFVILVGIGAVWAVIKGLDVPPYRERPKPRMRRPF